MPWDHPRPYTLTMRPEQSDIDDLNHTNNAVYVRWCERAAWAHSEALGLPIDEYRRLDRAMALRRAHYDYLLPTFEGEALTLGTWLLESDGRLTLTRVFQLVRDRDRATVLRGRWELVCIELASGRARRMPAEFVQAYVGSLVGCADGSRG